MAWTRFVNRALLIGTSALGLAATTTMAAPYQLLTTIAVPAGAANTQPGGAFTSFDISFFDPATGNDYVADRSNAAVDVFSGSSLTFLGRATGFTGQQATTSVSGPDGVLTVTTGGVTTLYAGDGNSSMRVYNATNPAAPSLLQTISTPGTKRVDEMAYSPATGQVLAANNADAPAFGTLFQTTAGKAPVTISKTNITIPGAASTDGLEQPVWNPKTGSFFISVPSFAGDQGGVAEIKTDGTVGKLFKFASTPGGPAQCSSAGLAVGASGNMLVGCNTAGAQAVLIDTNGNILKTFPQVTLTDEIWYDPASGDFFVTGTDPSGNRIFAIINDASQSFVTAIPLVGATPGLNTHSIAVDSLNGDVFVPMEGTTATAANNLCSLGCIAVYASVPEPPTLPLVAAGVLGLIAVMGWRARRT